MNVGLVRQSSDRNLGWMKSTLRTECILVSAWLLQGSRTSADQKTSRLAAHELRCQISIVSYQDLLSFIVAINCFSCCMHGLLLSRRQRS